MKFTLLLFQGNVPVIEQRYHAVELFVLIGFFFALNPDVKSVGFDRLVPDLLK